MSQGASDPDAVSQETELLAGGVFSRESCRKFQAACLYKVPSKAMETAAATTLQAPALTATAAAVEIRIRVCFCDTGPWALPEVRAIRVGSRFFAGNQELFCLSLFVLYPSTIPSLFEHRRLLICYRRWWFRIITMHNDTTDCNSALHDQCLS